MRNFQFQLPFHFASRAFSSSQQHCPFSRLCISNSSHFRNSHSLVLQALKQSSRPVLLLITVESSQHVFILHSIQARHTARSHESTMRCSHHRCRCGDVNTTRCGINDTPDWTRTCALRDLWHCTKRCKSNEWYDVHLIDYKDLPIANAHSICN